MSRRRLSAIINVKERQMPAMYNVRRRSGSNGEWCILSMLFTVVYHFFNFFA